MTLRIGLENNVEGHTLAWALDHPGCFTSGENPEDALAEFPAAFDRYTAWILLHAAEPWLDLAYSEFRVEETWDVYQINEAFELVESGYEVNAWFLNDWKPLTALEIERGLGMLSWSRQDLFASLENLTPEAANFQMPGERWSIYGILKHIAGAEWWYLDRLGLAFPPDQVPEEPFARLEVVRAGLIRVLPTLIGAVIVRGIDGEFWSPRKLLRRALWHEIDHTRHIHKLRIPDSGL